MAGSPAALTVVAALLTLIIAPAMAQQQPSPAPARPAPGAPATQETTKEVEGTVKKVDPGTKSVQISAGLLGIFGATLELTEETRIRVEGKQGSLADIREGAKVKASYETRDGKNVAKAMDVLPAESKEQPPARPAPPAGTPAPPAGQPRTQ
jgi:Cu/Ag efflux protein CusF